MGAPPLPEEPKPPPPPPDETNAIFRELARLNTQRELQRSGGRARAFAPPGGRLPGKARTGI